MLRICTILSATIACGLLGWASYSSFFARWMNGDPSGWVVENPDRELGELSIGEHQVEYQITNSTDQALRVLGIDGGGCTASHCFRSMVDVPARPIKPGESFVFRCSLQLYKPGEFNASFVVFLEDGGTRTMTLSVKGIGVEKKDKRND